jgi:sRNA-binding carbon storage regulator CsrA|tara:strand:+ start:1512 stop:1718 length:207 start_codon:yes stop_codon:yes gene_type:complete
MMLKLTRKVQQAIVVHPRGAPDDALTLRVVDIVPNAVCLGLAGDGYEIHRAEKFNDMRNKSHEQNNSK